MSTLLAALLAMFTPATKQSAGPITTCQWPNTCEAVAQVQTCVWPHVCSVKS